MKAPQFREGDVVTWTDPDEDNVMKPHVGIVMALDVHDGSRVYFIQESEDLFQLVLEEELRLVKRRE